MPHKQPPHPTAFDYEPVVPPTRRSGVRREHAGDEGEWPPRQSQPHNFSEAETFDELTGDSRASIDELTQDSRASISDSHTRKVSATRSKASSSSNRDHDAAVSHALKRGHALSFAGLFLFTTLLFFRPYELIPALSFLKSSAAFYAALLTLLIFIPTQVSLEGTLTARPREVNLVLLLAAFALLSLPLAINRGEAWDTFMEFLKVVAIFIVIVNTVRTERRLRLLIGLVLAASCVLGVGALRDYGSGKLTVDGYRVTGVISGIFGNPNDLALHFATMIPVTVALFLATRGLHKKLAYAACAVLMVGGLAVTFSRGGFLGLAAGALVLAWKLGRRNRLAVMVAAVFVLIAAFAFAPGNYSGRMASILDKSLDANGSSVARQELLIVSVKTALRHPFLGVGLGNFHIVSIGEHVSHNAYTQVAAETGMAACVVYVLFLLTPRKRLRLIEEETLDARATHARFYYLSVGLQASLAAYMVSSFFGSVAFQWYIYYLVGYAVCLRRIYEATLEAESSASITTKTGDAPIAGVVMDNFDAENGDGDEEARGWREPLMPLSKVVR